jgi:hypothetical protein
LDRAANKADVFILPPHNFPRWTLPSRALMGTLSDRGIFVTLGQACSQHTLSATQFVSSRSNTSNKAEPLVWNLKSVEFPFAAARKTCVPLLQRALISFQVFCLESSFLAATHARVPQARGHFATHLYALLSLCGNALTTCRTFSSFTGIPIGLIHLISSSLVDGGNSQRDNLARSKEHVYS